MFIKTENSLLVIVDVQQKLMNVMNLLNVKANATEMILEGLMDHVQDMFSGKK